jgi:hypothetical protein
MPKIGFWIGQRGSHGGSLGPGMIAIAWDPYDTGPVSDGNPNHGTTYFDTSVNGQVSDNSRAKSTDPITLAIDGQQILDRLEGYTTRFQILTVDVGNAVDITLDISDGSHVVYSIPNQPLRVSIMGAITNNMTFQTRLSAVDWNSNIGAPTGVLASGIKIYNWLLTPGSRLEDIPF